MVFPRIRRRALAAARILGSAALAVALAGVIAGCRRAPASAAVESPVGAAAAAERPARLAVVAEPALAAPGGSVTLLWHFEPAAGWHLYWDGRNDSGFAPRQRLRLPPGWTAGPLRWPAPVRHVAAGDILDHVYDGPFTLLQDVKVPAAATAGAPLSIGARWDWLACRDACVPGRDSLSVAITVVADGATTGTAVPSATLTAARARLPRPWSESPLTWRWDGSACVVERGGAVTGGRLTFMPAADCGELVDLLHDGVGENLRLRLRTDGGHHGPLRGLVVVAEPDGAQRAYVLDVPANTLSDANSRPQSPPRPTGGIP